jgi:nicotinate phosphoribosyltransferase
MPGALLTDLYELNMAASYLRRDMIGPATFSLYVRNLPPSRGFLVAAGQQACLDALESFSFDEDELRYLRTIGFDEQDVEAFRGVRFDGEVWAVAEGRIVHAGEPIMEITASLPAAQLVETLLLNQVTLHTTVATKAARYRLAAPEKDLVDFAFRRTHGREAAMAVARDSAIVGFTSTSNVEAARRYGLDVAGTMAHSYIEAFPSEIEAFRAYAEDHPERTTFLVDTYDTLQGVANAIEVVQETQLTGRLGIRLDSGDLLELSRGARKLLDEAGLTQVRIFASGGLDELEVQDLVADGAPLDAFGIGTQMGVSADAPFVDSVYKLVDIDGRPVLKLSAGKATAPGRKQAWRGSEGDVLSLRDEPGMTGAEPLLEPVMHDGVRAGSAPSIEEMRARFDADLVALPAGARPLRDATPVEVRHSDALVALTASTRDEALRRSGADDGEASGHRQPRRPL